MYLRQLKAENFRLLRTLDLQPDQRLNLFLGANAAGKTSLLEAVYTLARGKSFRGGTAAELAGPAGRRWLLFGRVLAGDGARVHHLGLRWADGSSEIRVDGRAATSLSLLQSLPVQILEPGTHRMLQDGPAYRRSFLDWGVFHVEPSFMAVWQRYRRALRQRNEALRTRGGERELAAWEPELADAGEALDRLRRTHLQQLAPAVDAQVSALLGEGEWQFELHPGWMRGTPLREALARQRAADRRLGTTQQGPHRAELRVRAGGHAVKHRISRGQQKLLIGALVLAQSEEIGRATGAHPVLLIDDFGAELAERYQSALLSALRRYPGQLFMTAFERSGALAQELPGRVFHVEQGALREL